jgi:hypothetical protein
MISFFDLFSTENAKRAASVAADVIANRASLS